MNTIRIEHAIPAEILLMIGNHLPLKSYIQLSQTCRTLQRILNSTNAIGYLNKRFKFGEDTGSLLLFTYYNILNIPEALSRLVLNHFLNSSKNNMSCLIKGWSLVHAIQCLDPGRFMTLLLADENAAVSEKRSTKVEQEAVCFSSIEKRKSLLVQHQRIFAREIIDSIITSQMQCKSEVSRSKTYQTVFQKLVQSGDLRTVENCLRSLGPPIDCCITLSDSDYSNRFPLIERQLCLNRPPPVIEGHHSSDASSSSKSKSVETICRDMLYLNYNAHEMRSLTESLMEQYGVRVLSAPGESYRSDDHYSNAAAAAAAAFHANHNTSTTTASTQHYYQRRRHAPTRRASN